MSLDQQLLLWINQTWATPGSDLFFTWISETWSFSIPLAIALLVFCGLRFGADGVRFWLAFLGAVVLGDALGNVFKHLLAQPRPCLELVEYVRQPAGCGAALRGMPSNHALNSALAAAFLATAFRSRTWAVTLTALAIAIGISRIYLAKHFPSQVLAGWALGAMIGYATARFGASRLAFMQRVRGQLDAAHHASQG